MPNTNPKMPPKPELGTYEVKLRSGRTVVMRDLSMKEQMRADSCAASQNEIGYYRAIAQAQSIDGLALPAVQSKGDLEHVMDFFTGPEADELGMAFVKRSGVFEDLEKTSTRSVS